jgi:hypothetical protein
MLVFVFKEAKTSKTYQVLFELTVAHGWLEESDPAGVILSKTLHT